MDFSWSRGPSTADVALLVARKQYGRAIGLLREQLEADPGNPVVRQHLADVLILDGQGPEAAGLLDALADEYARSGHAPKAIALLKKVQRFDRDRPDVEERLARLLHDGGAEAPDREGGGRSEIEPGPGLAAPEPRPGVPTPAEAAAASPLFGDLAEDELLALIRGLDLNAFEPGDVIVTEGETSDSLFVIATGLVKVFVRDPIGRSRLVRTMGDGAFFGELSLLTGKPRTATVTAATRCELLELDRERLNAISGAHPRVLSVLQSFARLRARSAAETAIRTGEA